MVRKRILQLIPNLNFGGAQRVVKSLTLGLSSEYDVIECVFNLENGHAYPSGTTIVNLDVPAGRNVIEKAFRFAQRCLRVRRIKKQHKIDITISHLEGADYVNFFSRAKDRIIFCVHGSKANDANIHGLMGVFRKKILIPFIYPRADRIVVVADGIKDELTRDFSCRPERIDTINNGLDIADVQKMSQEQISGDFQALFSRHSIAICHGRLVPEKNQQWLLQLQTRIKNRCKLVIIGDGVEQNKLLAKCDSLGLNTFHHTRDEVHDRYDVYFLGYQSNPFKYLSRAHVFLFPSIYEGYPLAICEAMACKLPIISSDTYYGPRDILLANANPPLENGIIRGEYGIIIPDHNQDAWVLAITGLLDDPGLRGYYAQQSLKRSESFNLSNFIGRWENALKR
jgi:glycosyltransferase involved in cell wall biosynthesis